MEIAQQAAANNPVIEPKHIQERVTKMKNVESEKPVSMPPPGTSIHDLTGQQQAAVGRSEVQRLIREGIIKPASESADRSDSVAEAGR